MRNVVWQGVTTALVLGLAATAYGQEAEYERTDQGETPSGYAERWDSQGYGVMETWDDGDGNPQTFMVAGYVESWDGAHVWVTVHIDSEAGTMDVWDGGVNVPEWITQGGDGTFDGVPCRDRQAMNRVMWGRFEGNMKAAVVAGIFGAWHGGPIGGIVGYTGTFTLRFLWDAGAVAWACR